MTTWAFNAIRELVASPDALLLWIDPGSQDEERFVAAPGMVIGKCHHYSPALAKSADVIVYSYRDLRTAAVSAYRKFGATGSREQLDTWIAVERLWLREADLVLRYEEVEADPHTALRELARVLSACGLSVSQEAADAVLSRIDAAFSRRENAKGPGFDPATLILAGHRTYQPAAESLPPKERVLYLRVQEEFEGWLGTHGYISGEPPAAEEPGGAGLDDYLRALMRESFAKEREMQRLLEESAELQAARADAEKKLREAVDDLDRKQEVMDEQSLALAAYRSSFVLLKPVIVPLNWVAGTMMRSLKRAHARVHRLTAVFRPKLGILNQHPPRPLLIELPAVALPRPAPRISIVTPSFRQARFIERTILSVVDQHYPDLEYFVQDGGSRDGTVEILERHAARLTGWVSERDTGQSQAINRGFARTTGEIMAWLNSDDILFPGALAIVADFFARNPGVDVIYGHRVLIDENDGEVGRWLLPPHDDKVLSWADFIPQETLFWRRSIWEKAGAGIDETFRFAMDWDLLLRFRAAGARFARVPRFLGGFRVHPQQKTSAGISDVGFAEMNKLRERTLGRVPSQAEVMQAVVPYMVRHTATHMGWRLRLRLGMQA